MAFSLKPDNGFVAIEGDIQPPVKLDLYESYNHYVSLCAAHQDAIEKAKAWIEYLVSKGLPSLSHGEAYRLADHLTAEVEEFRKKYAAQPA